MLVLITGATGFIGRHLVAELLRAGHEVLMAVHTVRARDYNVRQVSVDYTQDVQADRWLSRLKDVDVVINAVGILRERTKQDFESLHTRAPQALFAACEQAGVKRVIQISALGADAAASSRYHLSKRAADMYLTTTLLDWVIVQPALVYGSGGTSARLFTTLASLPLIPVPGGGVQCIQPIHIDDLVAAVMKLLDSEWTRRHVALVGPNPLTLKVFLGKLRAGLGLGRPHFVSVPMFLVRVAASLATLFPGVLLDRETLSMLERGNVGDVHDTRALLGREPRAPEDFIEPTERDSQRLQAQLNWLLPTLRWSIALVWIVTGIVSLGVYPVSESYALLARVGATGPLASMLLYGAALLDLAFGIGILVVSRRRWLWLAQIAVIVGYTLIITIKLPEFWIHPYGPVLKNLPMLAAIYLLHQLERR